MQNSYPWKFLSAPPVLTLIHYSFQSNFAWHHTGLNLIICSNLLRMLLHVSLRSQMFSLVICNIFNFYWQSDRPAQRRKKKLEGWDPKQSKKAAENSFGNNKAILWGKKIKASIFVWQWFWNQIGVFNY